MTERTAATKKTASSRKTAASQKKPAATTTDPAPGLDATVLNSITDDATAALSSYLKELTAISSASLTSIQAGTYKVEDVWSDGIKLWSTYTGSLGAVFQLGTRTAQAFGTGPGGKG